MMQAVRRLHLETLGRGPTGAPTASSTSSSSDSNGDDIRRMDLEARPPITSADDDFNNEKVGGRNRRADTVDVAAAATTRKLKRPLQRFVLMMNNTLSATTYLSGRLKQRKYSACWTANDVIITHQVT
jgi:hypothetical protein